MVCHVTQADAGARGQRTGVPSGSVSSMHASHGPQSPSISAAGPHGHHRNNDHDRAAAQGQSQSRSKPTRPHAQSVAERDSPGSLHAGVRISLMRCIQSDQRLRRADDIKMHLFPRCSSRNQMLVLFCHAVQDSGPSTVHRRKIDT